MLLFQGSDRRALRLTVWRLGVQGLDRSSPEAALTQTDPPEETPNISGFLATSAALTLFAVAIENVWELPYFRLSKYLLLLAVQKVLCA